MVVPKDNQDEFAAFQSGPLEDLTIQDGLIISAIYAVESDWEKIKRISEFARKHPLFFEKPEDTSARVNKFANLMQGEQSVIAVEAAARVLKPEHRQQAFEFATEAALEDNELTNDKKKSLQKLATKLDLDNEFVEQKLATIQDKSVR